MSVGEHELSGAGEDVGKKEVYDFTDEQAFRTCVDQLELNSPELLALSDVLTLESLNIVAVQLRERIVEPEGDDIKQAPALEVEYANLLRRKWDILEEIRRNKITVKGYAAAEVEVSEKFLDMGITLNDAVLILDQSLQERDN